MPSRIAPMFSEEWVVAVRRGKVPGYEFVAVTAKNDAVGTSLESIWPEGGQYVFPTSASTMTVSSDDANDDLAIVTGKHWCYSRRH